MKALKTVAFFMSTLWALYPSFHIQLSPTPEITFLLKFAQLTDQTQELAKNLVPPFTSNN